MKFGENLREIVSQNNSISALISSSSKISSKAAFVETQRIKSPSSVPENPPVTNPVQDAPVQSAESAESAECNGHAKSVYLSEPAGDTESIASVPVEVNINIDKTQGNAIYSSLIGIQGTLDNFKLDVKQDSMKEVVSNAVKEATTAHWNEITRKEKEEANKRRELGEPGSAFKIHQAADKRNEELHKLDIEHMEHYTASNKAIHDRLNELLSHTNLYPLQTPHLMDEKGHLLLKS